MKCLTNQTLKGIKSDCNPSLAGIAKIYLGYYGDFDATVAVASSATPGTYIVTGFTSAATAVNAKLYPYEFNKQTGSLTSTLTKDEANGTRYFTNEVVLQFTKLEAAKHLEMSALAAEKLVGIVIDNNGKSWYVGYDGYLSATEGTAQTGQSYDDLNGYNITLQQMSAYLPFEIAPNLYDNYRDDKPVQDNG